MKIGIRSELPQKMTKFHRLFLCCWESSSRSCAKQPPKMAELDSLEYYIKFPKLNFSYTSQQQNIEAGDYVVVGDDEKTPVILLFGWAGCQDKYLAKYSQIYEEKGLITLRYTAPVKCLFWKRLHMITIGHKLVNLLEDLNFDGHPVFVHCFSNGGAFLYQNFTLALAARPSPVQIKGAIFDSAPGRRRLLSLFRAVSAILGGRPAYNLPASALMTLLLSLVWFYETVCNYVRPVDGFPSNPLDNLKDEGARWPQHFIFSKADDLIPHTDVEYFANYRKSLGVDVTTLCYESSPHVKHYSENKESYTDSVWKFINKCLNKTERKLKQ